jgi:glyoxylase-like metal-dependent hydrolase (beta-lactamase superfamily II)
VPPTLPSLAPDRLQVLIFGPGFGELVLVRAPPGDWLVLDGCATRDVASYALAVLDHYHHQNNVRFIAMTHPHEDHAGVSPSSSTHSCSAGMRRVGHGSG